MGITIVDIAKRAGVSHPVVSKVLNGGCGNVGVSEEKRCHILHIAKEMGYKPHGASQALRTKSFKSVGVLTGNMGEFYFPQESLSLFTHELNSKNYTCSLVCVDAFDAQNILASPLLKAHLVDVLVISYVYEPPVSVVKAVEDMGINTIWLNRVVDKDAIFADETDATAQLVRHLAACGHKEITYVDLSGEGGQNPVIANRLKGFAQEAEALGVKTLQMTHKRMPRGQRKSTICKWLSDKDRPSAIIANSLSSAQIIMLSAIELGISIPGELAIASFDNGTSHQVLEPGITCAMYPTCDFGKIAAQMALSKADSPNVLLDSKCLKFSLSIQGSTVLQN